MQDEQLQVLATAPATSTQTRWAAIIALGLLAATVVTLPFGNVQLPVLYLFAPIAQTAIFVVDLIIAALLFAQFSLVRSRGLLVLAGGCIFTSMIMVPHTAAFLQIFADPPPTAGTLDVVVWLYVFWHTGLPLAVIGYVLLNNRAGAEPIRHERVPLAIAASTAAALLAVCLLTWLANSGYLPTMMAHPMAEGSARAFLAPVLVSAGAIVLLWRYRCSVLDVWLLVMLWAWLVDNLLHVVPVLVQRFSVGWYSGRIYGLISTIMILVVLIADATSRNARLVISAMAHRRESANRAAMMEAIAASITHEVRQPLTAISLKSLAGVMALQKTPPDLAGARASFERIDDSVQRAAHIMDTVRGMFVKSTDERVSLDCNDLVRDVLSLVRDELDMRGIAVLLDLAPQLPRISGNKMQLQQVISNLVLNAADAMSGVTGRPRILGLSSLAEGKKSVLMSVRDTGVGIDPGSLEKIFEAFFTTKKTGTGLGLAICRWIVTLHGGELWASPNHPFGSTFFLRLPVHETSDRSWRLSLWNAGAEAA